MINKEATWDTNFNLALSTHCRIMRLHIPADEIARFERHVASRKWVAFAEEAEAGGMWFRLSFEPTNATHNP